VFNLYGDNFDDLKSGGKNIFYKGSFSPNKIQNEFTEGFGLVWDGNSIGHMFRNNRRISTI
jgi:hypothetical protein